MGHTWYIAQPASSSFMDTCQTQCLLRQRSFLGMFIIKQRHFSWLIGSGGGIGCELQEVISLQQWFFFPNWLQIWSFIKKVLNIFRKSWLLATATISLPSFNPLLVVMIVKVYGKKEKWLNIHHYAAYVKINREWFWSGERNFFF